MASGSTRASAIAFVPARGAIVLGVDEQRDATDHRRRADARVSDGVAFVDHVIHLAEKLLSSVWFGDEATMVGNFLPSGLLLT